MNYAYMFEPSRKVFLLRAASRIDAENRLKAALDVQSQVAGRSPPDAVVLLEDGLEVWRWTQADRWGGV